ncbi:hypothetical protein V3Q20_19675 [Clostridioides difficile]|uniref:hypothetical protein n=1 Tax=Clostridium phage phiCD6356 TaxID=864178 RepID=UPI0001DE02B5|nr:hypothetical protein [Clostridioides difficile]YP_004306140.1 hypothetical protein phiCD6356_39 [Clostridium phage phiCD6356]ADK37901.1 hypothetical protein phiCD6356_39 [Clostridium phage phiCD6356]MDO0341198.1 hypothetical protein [Clostridioides difficile]SJW88270.1 Uncharacterised protein [Clostridioides difficile]HBG8565732.1 hypothetical protein [Clostridioides difficile]
MVYSSKEKIETALMIEFLKKNDPRNWESIETLISSTYTLSNFKKRNKISQKRGDKIEL